MSRVLVLTLVAAQVLLPPGVCLRQFGCGTWLSRTTGTAGHANHPTSKAVKRHAAKCCSGCRHRETETRTAKTGVGTADTSHPRAIEGRTPLPTDQHSDSECRATCKAKSDKIAPHENPQVEGELLSLGFVSAVPLPVRPPRPGGPAVDFTPPPRYVTFCTFLF